MSSRPSTETRSLRRVRFRAGRDAVELRGKVQASKDKYDEIMESPLIDCVKACMKEFEENGVMPVLSEEDLKEFEVRLRRDCEL